MEHLLALSPADGRYATKVDSLRHHLSEFGLIKHRVAVEVAWFAALCNEPGIPELATLTSTEEQTLQNLVAEFSVEDARAVKD